MEKITSGLPPPLFTTILTIHYPQNTQTLITLSLFLSLSLYIHKRSVSLYRFLPLSLPPSLSPLSYTSPLSSHKGFDFFFLTAIASISILVLFTRTVSRFNLLHYWASMWLLSVAI